MATFSDDQIDLNYRSPEVLLAWWMYCCVIWKRARNTSVWMPWLYVERAGNKLHPSGKNTSVIKLLRSIIDDVAPGTVIITRPMFRIKTTLLTLAKAMTKQYGVPVLAAATGAACGAKTELEALCAWAQNLTLPSSNTTWLTSSPLTMASG